MAQNRDETWREGAPDRKTDHVAWLDHWRRYAADLYESNALGDPEDMRRAVGAMEPEAHVRSTLDALRECWPDELPPVGTDEHEIVVESLTRRLARR